MKTYRKLLALLLTAMLLLSCLTACGQKEPEPDESPDISDVTEPEEPSQTPGDLTAAGGFDQDEIKQDDSQAGEPDESDEIATGENLTYGGVPIMNVINFITSMEIYGHDACIRAFGEDKADSILSEWKSTYYKYKTLPAQDMLDWLDGNFIYPIEPNYKQLSSDDLEILRNMILVIRSAAGGYAPSELKSLESFLTEPGMEIYHKWRDQIASDTEPTLDDLADPDNTLLPDVNQSGNQTGNQTGDNNNTQTGTNTGGQTNETNTNTGTQSGETNKTAAFTITSTQPDLSNKADNGDVRVSLTVTCPDLAGSDQRPQFVFLHKDAYGATINTASPLIYSSDPANGTYTYALTFNERSYTEDGSYMVNPVEGHLYAFRVPADFQIASWRDLTVEQCVLIY